MPEGAETDRTADAVREVRRLRLRGKDYLYCKMYLMTKGFSETASNNVWYAAEKTQTGSERATALALQGPYYGIFFFGGVLGVVAYFTIARYFGFLASTVFSFIFLRYSSAAMKRTPLGFALSVKSDLYREPEPPEASWFNYGVIAGFLFFAAGVFYFPSFLGWTPELLWASLTSISDPEKMIPKF
ncbi:MAG: hypothetical protein V1787_04335 [Candidatus Micrarchaeota archaeon]